PDRSPRKLDHPVSNGWPRKGKTDGTQAQRLHPQFKTQVTLPALPSASVNEEFELFLGVEDILESPLAVASKLCLGGADRGGSLSACVPEGCPGSRVLALCLAQFGQGSVDMRVCGKLVLRMCRRSQQSQ